MEWAYMGKAVTFDGTTNYYKSDSPYSIESRKRKCPSGTGYFWRTSFFVIKDGKEVAEKSTLCDAEALVEMLMEGET